MLPSIHAESLFIAQIISILPQPVHMTHLHWKPYVPAELLRTYQAPAQKLSFWEIVHYCSKKNPSLLCNPIQSYASHVYSGFYTDLQLFICAFICLP